MASGVKGFASKTSRAQRGKKTNTVLLLTITALVVSFVSGCAGLANSSNANPSPAAVQITPAILTFPNVRVGQQATQNATLTNTGNTTISITRLSLSSAEFSAMGVAMPLSLGPGQSAKFQVAFRSSTVGSVAGTLTALTAHGDHSTKVKLSGGSTATPSQLSLSMSSLSYGNVLVNGSSTQAVTLQNTGSSNINISQITVSGPGFSVSGVAAPTTLPAGHSAVLQATFAPAAAGAANGSITIASDAQNATSSIALSGTGVAASYSMSLVPSNVSFGNVNVGSTATQVVQLTNTGNSSFTVTQVAAGGAGVSVNGISTPLTVAPSQTVPLTVTYTPSASSATSGSVTVTNNDGVSMVAAVTGTGIQAGLSVSPAIASFGSVMTGNTSTQAIQLKNTGSASLTISQATVTGAGFSVSGMTFPATLAPGQSSTLSVQYAPSAAGAVSGSVSIVSSAPNSPATVALSGTGAAASYTMSLSPASVSFASVSAGSTATQPVTLTNTGNASVTITQVSASGTGLSVSGLSSGVTLAPSQTAALTVTYAPSASGTTTGSISVTNSQGVSVSDAVSGSAVQAGLTVTPGSANFGSVVTGNTNSQTVQIKNSGSGNLTISQAIVTGAGFSLSGLGLPMTLAPGQSTTFNAQYAPTVAGGASGSISISSNAPNSPTTVGLSGSGVAATYTLSVSPASLSFGSVNDGSTASQSFSVTNTGNSNVSISGMAVSGTGFALLSGGGAVTLSPNQSVSGSVQFAPTVAGAASGSISISGNAAGSPAGVSLSGTGVAPVSHSVGLAWGASTSTVAGYNVYRSTVSGGSYSKVNSSLLGGLTFSDSNVSSGTTYYYVATSVDASGTESVYSNEASAIVP